LIKLIVDFGTLLIVAEGANPAKMHPHFLRAVFIRGCLFNVLRECGSKGDPAGAERLERKSKGKSLTEPKNKSCLNQKGYPMPGHPSYT
jgi:hypothetical protein